MRNPRRARRFAAGGLLAVAVLGACTTPPGEGGTASTTSAPQPARTERVSVASDGSQGNGSSAGATAQPTAPAISADGRYVAFTSTSTNFAGDGNSRDVFLRDRTAGTTTLVSSGVGAQYPAISDDGRYVGFTTSASTLVAGDTNAVTDVFVWDRTDGTTQRVSVASDGAQASGSSGNVSAPSLSSDGRYIAFRSDATNLVPDDTNGRGDVFVRDRIANVTTRVSVFSDGTQSETGSSDWPSISDDGRYVAFESNGLLPGVLGTNVFVRDRTAEQTSLISVTTTTGANNGPSGRAPSVSADGRFVAFHSTSSLLAGDDGLAYNDIHVRDRVSNTTVRAPSAPNSYQSYYPDISADGRYAAFETNEPLVPEDTNFGTGDDVYVWDLISGSVKRASVTTDGSQASGYSEQASISSSGRFVAFVSFADDLVADDTSPGDVFVRDTGT